MHLTIPRLSFLCILFVLCSTMLVAQSRNEFLGEWKGKLNAGGALLTIVFNVNVADGKLVSTMDSPDQGAYGIKVGGTVIDKDNITFVVPSVGGRYEGKLDESWVIIKGTWKQAGQSFDLSLNKQAAKSVSPDEIEFDEIYQGKLNAGGYDIRLVLKIYKKDSGELAAFIDSPDQGAENITVSSILKSEDELFFEVNLIKGAYKGKFKDEETVEGTWEQAGQTMELNFKLVDEVEKLKRPQTPKKPYPYKEEEVKFGNDKAGIDLSGTFTLPNGKGPFPTVVLVTGSGAQDRDETIFGHKPFWVIADYLTRNGIAVLRYDERGVGESEGSFETATTRDFADDANAAVHYLSGRREVDRNNIGIIGHSEGGLVAPMVAVNSDEMDFIVMLAGPGLPGKDILLMQTELISRVAVESEEDISKATKLNKKIYDIIEKEPDNDAALTKINVLLDEYYAELHDSVKSNPTHSKEAMQANLKKVMSKWFRFFISYDPRPALEKITIPVLAINGEKDLQVPPKENLEAIDRALTIAGNKNYKTIELPGLNHLFQTSETGAITEYRKLEETFSEDAMELMKDWIMEVTKRKG